LGQAGKRQDENSEKDRNLGIGHWSIVVPRLRPPKRQISAWDARKRSSFDGLSRINVTAPVSPAVAHRLSAGSGSPPISAPPRRLARESAEHHWLAGASSASAATSAGSRPSAASARGRGSDMPPGSQFACSGVTLQADATVSHRELLPSMEHSANVDDYLPALCFGPRRFSGPR